MKAIIKWESDRVIFGERVFLFCFGERCMSGKVVSLSQKGDSEYAVRVEFIEVEYFKKELKKDNVFTIREASQILGKGRVE